MFAFDMAYSGIIEDTLRVAGGLYFCHTPCERGNGGVDSPAQEPSFDAVFSFGNIELSSIR
jgi:hypothetical protein